MTYTPVPNSTSATLTTLTGLTAKQIVFGAADGTGTSSADAQFDDSTNDLNISASESGGTVGILLANTSNTASSAAREVIQVAGGTAADPALQFTVSGVQSYSLGIDNSVSGDPLVLSVGTALGTTDVLSVNASGEIGINVATETGYRVKVGGTGALDTAVITTATTSYGAHNIGAGGSRLSRYFTSGSAQAGNAFGGEANADLAGVQLTNNNRWAIGFGSTLRFIVDNQAASVGAAVVPTGVSRAFIGGTIKSIHSDVGNVGAGEDTLHTYTLPAGMLAADGQAVEVEAIVTFAANANNKRIRLYFGATAVFDTGSVAQNGGSAVIRATIARTGAATQRAMATLVGDPALLALLTTTSSYTTPTETLSGTVVIRSTGEATSNDDVVCRITRVNWAAALN